MFICTAEKPWTPDNPDKDIRHPDVMPIGTEWNNTQFFNAYRCKYCGNIELELKKNL